MLKWIFKRYRNRFEDFFLEEYFGFIPSDTKEPSLKFLAQNRQILEKFFSLQAYNMMKRARNDDKNYDRYMGFLAHIRFMLMAIQREKIERYEATIPETPAEDLMKKVVDFVAEAKKKIVVKK